MIVKKGEKVWKKQETCIKIPLLNTRNGTLCPYFSVQSGICQCRSYYQRVNAATVKFRKFGIVPVASLERNKECNQNVIEPNP